MFQTYFARACQFLSTLVIGGLISPPGVYSLARAEEPTGLQAAAAIESAMVSAIAAAEKSVVSIARIPDSGRDDEASIVLRPRAGGVNQLRSGDNDPRDPDFVPKEWATGVVIDAAGLILTNYHCLREDDVYLVTTINRKVFRCSPRPNSSQKRTSIYAADPRSDLAVLKIDSDEGSPKIAKDDFVPIKFGDAKVLRKGQIVVSLGNPYGIARDGQVSASWGIISNLARKLAPKPQGQEPTLHQFGTLIQTDARLNWGTSGGALVNLKGEMIGLTTSLAAAANGGEQGAGYAIPIDDTFKRIINTLKQGRLVEYGFLGVRSDHVLRPEETQGRHGLVIQGVTQGGPANRAGLMGGETITHINGEPVRDFDDLRLLIGRFSAGDSTSITFEHRGGTHVADVSLAKYRKQPFNKARDPIFDVVEPHWRGLRIDYATAAADFRAASENLPAQVAISEVITGSPAYEAGLRSGMFVAKVGNTPLDAPGDFRRVVSRLKGPVTLELVTDYYGPRQYITVGEK